MLRPSALLFASPRSPGDIRVELHALHAGGHVAVEPFEILDRVLGFVFVDFKNDGL